MIFCLRMMVWAGLLILGLLLSLPTQAQHSVARQWNEVVLQGIRNDFARPTVHARNLFHTSIAMYDSWAAFHPEAEPFFLGQSWDGYYCPLASFPRSTNPDAACEEALSYAVYRLIHHRFGQSPDGPLTLALADSLMEALGYDAGFTRLDYSDGNPAALGNYLAQQLIRFGLQDGSNEVNDYANQFYQPVNSFLFLSSPGQVFLRGPNRWQPLAFGAGGFIDQSGRPTGDEPPAFLSPEWGQVSPFALQSENLEIRTREGDEYWVYHDPGPPAFITPDENTPEGDEYRWGFVLVALWASHLSPQDSVMWDISPASIGNVPELPTTLEGLRDFYDDFEGGDPSLGHALNPATGQPYEPQMVPRGDYSRVLAEFWADGPDSETPPGHWFTILNYVNDQPGLQKRFKGEGAILGDLEWDVKSYFTLGGAMHDAAISAWSVKGWYDYVRPISAIRWMATQGQCTDTSLTNYHPNGLPLIPGYIEVIGPDDPLRDQTQVLISPGELKLRSWRGPDFINDPETDEAGVGWIRALNWWPYQRPSFVTPPFAGYVSGHSTFSRAAAEVLTLLTGDPYFPGGMGEFEVKKDEFLVFEEGPSVNFTLQWATYRDASDQTSLSRIWGGIHPPVDDIPGRRMGIEIGQDAFAWAERYFRGQVPSGVQPRTGLAFPNPAPVDAFLSLRVHQAYAEGSLQLLALDGRVLQQQPVRDLPAGGVVQLVVPELATGLYVLRLVGSGLGESHKVWIQGRGE